MTSDAAALGQQLAAEKATNELLRESLADVQRVMGRDEAGWDMVGQLTLDGQGFTPQFRKQMYDRAVIACAANPMIKRGVNLRGAYIWGDGVSISVRDDPGTGQDVNAVVQAFLDDPMNLATFSDTEARLEHERALALGGELAICLPTDPFTGRVRVRILPFLEITDIVTNPEDAASEWLYLRQWTQPGKSEIQKAYYPALSYRPAQRYKTLQLRAPNGTLTDTGIPIMWDSPVRFVRVNKVGQRGVGDVFAALPWADSYKQFLEAWKQLTLSLARFAYQAKQRGDRVPQLAADLARASQSNVSGQGIVTDPNTVLEAVGKSGATIDSDSGRPLAAMAAAGLDIPVTTLLGDPGVTGARAVASDVTESSWALFDVRRDLWKAIIRDVCSYVIDAAVIAPLGPLKGTIVRDGDYQTAQLPEGDGRTVIVDFPDRDDTTLLDKLKAIQLADSMDKLPALTIAREILSALQVDDVDEILAQITDENGDFLPPDLIDQKVRQRYADHGNADPNTQAA